MTDIATDEGWPLDSTTCNRPHTDFVLGALEQVLYARHP